MKVGFIGLGTMGLRMTMNLIKAGFEVHVVSRSRGPVEKAVAAGAIEANHPADLASKTDIVLTCLPMPDTVEQVYLGDNGILAGAKEGTIIADHSTVSPLLNRKIYDRAKGQGISFIDAPVSGGPMGAEAGTLTIMCGGDQQAFERALPVFQAMGKTVVRIGEAGSGSVVKLINNLLVGVHTAALSEVMIMAEKAGIDQDKLLSVLKASTGNSAMLDRIQPLIVSRRFEPLFSINLLHKDMKIALDLGESLGLELKLADVSTGMVGDAKEAGFGQNDICAVIRPLEAKFGVEVKKEK